MTAGRRLKMTRAVTGPTKSRTLCGPAGSHPKTEVI